MTDLEIKTKLATYLTGQLTRQEFQTWLAAATWDVDASTDEPLKQLVYALELAFAENHSGHLPEDELKKELAPLAGNFNIQVARV